MASNPVVDIFRVKDLRMKILFTLSMLVIFRLGAVIPIPGIDLNVLKSYFAAQGATGSAMGITEYLDFFAGGVECKQAACSDIHGCRRNRGQAATWQIRALHGAGND